MSNAMQTLRINDNARSECWRRERERDVVERASVARKKRDSEQIKQDYAPRPFPTIVRKVLSVK